MRKIIMKLQNAAREVANGDMAIIIKLLKPKEQRILITKIIADTHERLSESVAYFRGFC